MVLSLMMSRDLLLEPIERVFDRFIHLFVLRAGDDVAAVHASHDLRVREPRVVSAHDAKPRPPLQQGLEVVRAPLDVGNDGGARVGVPERNAQVHFRLQRAEAHAGPVEELVADESRRRSSEGRTLVGASLVFR